MREPTQVVINDKVFHLLPMKVRRAGELERKLLKALAPMLSGLGGVLGLLPELMPLLDKSAPETDASAAMKGMQLRDMLPMLDLNRLALGAQEALSALPDHEFDALICGMFSNVSTSVPNKGNVSLVTGDLIDMAIDSTAEMYQLMYEVARFNKFLPFGLLGAGDATPATAG